MQRNSVKKLPSPIARCLAPALMLAAACSVSGVIFDDFNTNEGHFNVAPNFSSTSVGEDASSTADRVTTDSPLEGAGHQKLVLVHDATTTALRIRHLSGSGTPSNNTSFTPDGWIGFYLKTTATGWQTSLNLDQPANTSGTMAGSTSVSIISDGEWHLYEWDLDTGTWGSVPGIGGTSINQSASYTIDSIYFRDLDGSPGPTATIYLDFVAHNPSGSVADLVPVPEPSTYAALFGMGLAAFAGYRRIQMNRK